MTIRPIHWMRLVLPRFDMVATFAAIVLIVEGMYYWMHWLGWSPDNSAFDYGLLRLSVYTLAALAYGVFRAVSFHPAVNEDYRRWLECTPWTPQHSLPAGPITLVLQDLIVILCLMGVNQELSLRCLYIPVAFLSAYQLTLAAVHWLLREWRLAYAVGFGMGAQCFFLGRPEFQLPIAVACYALTWLAVQRTLRRFPWDIFQSLETLKKSLNGKLVKESLGWPYEAMTPKPLEDQISRHDAICLPFLIGWWQLAVIWGGDLRIQTQILMFFQLGVCVLPLFRIVIYRHGYQSPIDLAGRIFTGRWIIPRHDCIWIASLVAWLVGLPLYYFADPAIRELTRLNPASYELQRHQILQLSLAPLGTTLMLLSLFLIGPKLQRWRLTGQHRMVFVYTNSKDEFSEL